jgi:hypothetical protein
LVYGKNRQVAKYAGSFLRMYENPLVGILRIHAGSPELKICRQFFIKAILYDFELLFLYGHTCISIWSNIMHITSHMQLALWLDEARLL